MSTVSEGKKGKETLREALHDQVLARFYLTLTKVHATTPCLG